MIGAVMSALANYPAVGMPAGAGANAADHAVSGPPLPPGPRRRSYVTHGRDAAGVLCPAVA
ncbi:hypothetical protein SUDANB178_01170 [Streptomyces sp. enrichment culture]